MSGCAHSFLLSLSRKDLAMNTTPQGRAAGSYAPVNGLNLYYEIHGGGEALILLHGGLGAIEMFGEVLPLLAADPDVPTLCQCRAVPRCADARGRVGYR